MRCVIGRHAMMASLALTLTACAIADSRSPVPEFMRAGEPDPPPPAPAPDVALLVRRHRDVIFVPTSFPRNVQVSAPHHDVRGTAWIACVRAELTSATGTPLGQQTYRLTIDHGAIVDRRWVGDEDNCVSARYAPVLVVKRPRSAVTRDRRAAGAAPATRCRWRG
jgi:hypothetical protein